MDIVSVQYEGPAGVIFTDEELLIIWSYLTRVATAENGEVRRRIQRYLETKGEGKNAA